MKNIYALIAITLFVMACQPIVEEPISLPQPFLNDAINVTEQQNETIVEEQLTQQQIDEAQVSYRVTVTEGELARIPVTAFDPDGGEVTITFQEPFNQDGLWLTRLGDEGRYLIKLQASDGFLTTTEYVLLDVIRANRPPVMECPRTVTVTETETVELKCNIVDPEGDQFTVRYDGWMTENTRSTTFGDRGSHTVIVRATDSQGATNSAEVTVNVQRLNRPPTIENLDDVSVTETETIRVTPKVTDPDGDVVNVTFGAPFNSNGTFTPEFGDRGTYNVTVTATDGEATVTENFKLTVLARNRPPVLEEIAPITVFEGETVRIPINAFDPDGDDLIISYSGWMTSRTRTTTFEDAFPNGCNERGCTATYFTTVTVSDGELEASQIVEINVIDRNRPPVFVFD